MKDKPKRLYQEIAGILKQRIINKEYQVGGKLPPERIISEELNISRTVVREAIIMLELEGMVEVRKGSGIHVISTFSSLEKVNEPKNEAIIFAQKLITEMESAGPFELLQARQLIETVIAAFAATQLTKKDLIELNEIQKLATENLDGKHNSKWDREFHIKLGEITKNSVLATLIEVLWFGRDTNPLWKKIHEHIDYRNLNAWAPEHQNIIDAITMKNPTEVREAMWSHLENTKQWLYDSSSAQNYHYDKYLFQDDLREHIGLNKK